MTQFSTAHRVQALGRAYMCPHNSPLRAWTCMDSAHMPCTFAMITIHPSMQGGLPASNGTRQFAQELFDKLPGKSGSNGRPPVAAPSQRTQEAAARAFLKQNARYALLDDEEDEDAAPVLPAPTTAALPKKREKKLRTERAGDACMAWGGSRH